MAILLNPRRRKRRKRANATKKAKARTRRRRRGGLAYAGETARPKLMYSGMKGGKKIYKRTEKSKTKYPDVIVQNPRRKRRKRNPNFADITETLMSGLYGAAGIAGVNVITNLASKFVNLDNVYLRNAVKLALGVGIPQMLRKQIGGKIADVISSVVVAYVMYELVKNLLPENVKSLVSAIEPAYDYSERNYLPNYELSAIYPDYASLTNERYEI